MPASYVVCLHQAADPPPAMQVHVLLCTATTVEAGNEQMVHVRQKHVIEH